MTATQFIEERRTETRLTSPSGRYDICRIETYGGHNNADTLVIERSLTEQEIAEKYPHSTPFGALVSREDFYFGSPNHFAVASERRTVDESRLAHR